MSRVLLVAVALLLAGCGSSVIMTSTRTAARARPQSATIAMGEPISPRPVETIGGPATVELRVEDPAGPDLPPILVTLVRPVPREPRDVCLGTYTGNESPPDGDVGCQVRGGEPLRLTLGDGFITGTSPTFRFVVLYGQLNRQVTLLALTGTGEVANFTVRPHSRQRWF